MKKKKFASKEETSKINNFSVNQFSHFGLSYSPFKEIDTQAGFYCVEFSIESSSIDCTYWRFDYRISSYKGYYYFIDENNTGDKYLINDISSKNFSNRYREFPPDQDENSPFIILSA